MNASEDKMTKAAREYLEEYLSNQRKMIIEDAKISAISQIGEVKEISIHDIINGIENTQKTKFKNFKELELFIAIFSTFFIFSAILTYILDYSNIIYYFLGLIGILGLLSVFMEIYFMRKNIKDQLLYKGKTDYSTDFLYLWNQLELSLKKIMVKKYGESSSRLSFSRQINILKSRKLLSLDESSRIHELLKKRNELVHGNATITEDDFIKLQDLLMKISTL